MSAQCTRHFLGWDSPTLDLVANWVLDRYSQNVNEIDLGDVDLVVPGGRAGRVLLGNLVDLCADRRVALVPPIILTPLELPAALLGVPGQHASKVTRKLAWIHALRSCDPRHLRAFIPNPPESDQLEEWIGFGNWIAGVAGQLCDAGMRMNEVSERGQTVLDDLESARWTLLGDLQSRYEDYLTERRVVDDRLVSLDRVTGNAFFDPTHTGRHLVLVGVADLGSIAQRTIEIAECEVDSLIFAPDSICDRFDEYGSILTDHWIDAEIEIDEERIVFAESSSAMCERALAELALRKNPIETSECVIGLGDETLISTLRRKASMGSEGSPIAIHAPVGIPASSTPPGQLVSLIHSHLAEHTFDSLVTLARHPDMERAFFRLDTESEHTRTGAYWIESLDQIRQDHVLSHAKSLPSGIRKKHAAAARFVIDSTKILLAPLGSPHDDPIPINHWAERLIQTLGLIYQGTELDSKDETNRLSIEGLRAIRVVADEINQSSQPGHSAPAFSSMGMLRLVHDRLGEMQIPEPMNRKAIESVGWLELLHDPSDICVVVGMSEACVPGSITHDPLLPGSLRNELGMPTNEHRLARDTYLMSAINASRDAVFMCARNGDKNDPITPSRLLLRASGARLANRVRRFVEPKLDFPPTHHLEFPIVPCGVDRFNPVLRISEGYTPPTSMSVTEFDTYLRSPAGWYLERRLALSELDTQTRELSPTNLGTLVHSVLDSFGKDESMRDLDDPRAIHDALSHLLDTTSISLFGTHPPAAILVQNELLRHRLRWFAHHQSLRRRQGWRIVHSEWSPDEANPPVMVVDDVPMTLKGKIDRIDIHEDGMRWAVIDYKTGKVEDPRKAHANKAGWIKLQLPLYRHLVKPIVGDSPIELGYMGLPSSDSDQPCDPADWDRDELACADAEAGSIIRQIRSFQPGDEVDMGSHPPDSGHLGFVTGKRYETGGTERVEEAEQSESEVVP